MSELLFRVKSSDTCSGFFFRFDDVFFHSGSTLNTGVENTFSGTAVRVRFGFSKKVFSESAGPDSGSS